MKKQTIPGHRPLNQASKTTIRVRHKFGISKSKSEDSEGVKSNKQRPNGRLPKLDKGESKPKTEVKGGSKSSQDSSKSGKSSTFSNRIRRNKKYANVASSGYGRTNYKPKMKSVNPSAVSTLTDPTEKTSGGNSGYISSRSFGDNPKKNRTSSARRQLAESGQEKTHTKLPVIR